MSTVMSTVGIACVALAPGCGDNIDPPVEPIPDTPDGGLPDAEPLPEPAFTLQLLHAADLEGGAEAVEDAPRFSAVLAALRAEMPEQTIVLSSGDNYIPGPFFEASTDDSLDELLGVSETGVGDILIANALGIQASALGNHEFDHGPGTVAQLVSGEYYDDGELQGSFAGTQFPYLSANLDFSESAELMDLVAEPGQDADTLSNRISTSTVVTVGDQRIGVVGATTPTLGSISSIGSDIAVSPEDPTDYQALADIIQVEVDALRGDGIDKIILVAHMQQIAVEQALAPLLADVDIIIAGGSNTILADDSDRLRAGDEAVDTYPLLYTSASGEPVALVNTDGNYRYVGRLVVGFDEDGVLMTETLDPEISGIYATDDQGVSDLGDPSPITAVADIAAALGDVLVARDSNIFGKTSVFLDGLRTSVRTEETNLGNLTADANLAYARMFVDDTAAISIKNGGGIRAPIGEVVFPPGSTDPGDAQYLPPPANPLADKDEGHISQFDLQNALRFNNGLSLLTVTAAELRALVEHAVAATEAGATPGQFPQVAGIRFSFDPALEAGSRVQSLAVVDGDGAVADVVVQGGELQGDDTRTFRLVTLSFLAGGGDGYPFPDTERVDLEDQGLDDLGITFAPPGTEQHSLAWYIEMMYPDETPYDAAEQPVEDDERIQNLSARSDTVLAN